MKNEIYIKHPNGYSGKLYGESSMSIFKDGKEVMHTGFRSEEIQTEEDLYKHLEDMPKFMNLLFGNIEDVIKEQNNVK